MAMRPLRLPGDLDVIGPMLAEAFQYPDHPEWSTDDAEQQQVADTFRNVRRFWPVIRALQAVTPALRHLLAGAVWEEDGRPVGLVTYQRLGRSNTWYMSTVAVLPDYRRRGIARRLVERAVADILRMPVDLISLDVIEENVPAVKLYESLGFVHYSGVDELVYDGEPPEPAHTASEVAVDPLSTGDWEARYRLEARVTPPAVQQFEPVRAETYHQPWAVRVIAPFVLAASGVRQTIESVQDGTGTIVGWGRLRTRRRPGGVHQLTVVADPDRPDVAEWLVGDLTRRALVTAPGRRVQLPVDDWQKPTIAAATAAGYTLRAHMLRMGLASTG